MTQHSTKTISHHDGMSLLESGQPVDLKLWKISTGDILEYKGARCIGSHWRGGTHRVRLPKSNLIREFRDVCCFEINGFKLYL